MKERLLKKIDTKVTNEGNRIDILNDNGTAIAKAQLAWLLLIANNVVEDLKVPTPTRQLQTRGKS